MADLRLLSRRVTDLENASRSSVSNPEVLESLATVTSVEAVIKRVADLESSMATYKKFLEEALEKLGLLEQKIVGVEAKVCQCGSDCGGDSVVHITNEPVATVQVTTITENPVYLEDSDDEDEGASPAEDASADA